MGQLARLQPFESRGRLQARRLVNLEGVGLSGLRGCPRGSTGVIGQIGRAEFHHKLRQHAGLAAARSAETAAMYRPARGRNPEGRALGFVPLGFESVSGVSEQDQAIARARRAHNEAAEQKAINDALLAAGRDILGAAVGAGEDWGEAYVARRGQTFSQAPLGVAAPVARPTNMTPLIVGAVAVGAAALLLRGGL